MEQSKAGQTSKSKKPRQIKQRKDVFVNVDPVAASLGTQAKGSLSSRRDNAQIQLDKLSMTVEQRQALDRLYERGEDKSHSFRYLVDDGPELAQELLRHIGLDTDALIVFSIAVLE